MMSCRARLLLSVLRRYSPIATLSRATQSILSLIGTPRGLNLTIANGIVSGKRDMKGIRYLQTTAPISGVHPAADFLTAPAG